MCLLVDADGHSMRLITEAMQELNSDGRVRDFLAQADVEYVPVPRSGEKDPTDEAIIDHMSRLKQNAAVKRVALLSSDAGFREAVAQLAFEKEVIVLLRRAFPRTRKQFEDAGARVVSLEPDDLQYKVRAVLRSDGSGVAELLSPFRVPRTDDQISEEIEDLLVQFGYKGPGRQRDRNEM
ncbi:unnamed protein product [Effrenium voratum]|nr:unnamed protein product [Effrenium voratum]